MNLMNTIKGKYLLMLSGLVIVLLVAVKLYFIPQVDRFLELSLEHEMKRNMSSFAKIIHIVTVAADEDGTVVQTALQAINNDPEIPIEFRSSKALNVQHGEWPEKQPRNSFEERVFRDGVPIFRKVNDQFEYIFPLKTTEVCQNCHFAEDGDSELELGYVLGLAVSTVPLEVLRKNNMYYFVKDLFVKNILLIALILVVISLGIWTWFFKPLETVTNKVQDLTSRDEEYYEFESGLKQYDEIQTLDLHIQELVKQNKT